jgi:hypothetical protein
VWGSSGEVNGEFDVTTKHAGLASADFEFSSKLSATNPVDPGSGVSFDLLDDETGYLRKLLAPRHGSTTRQTQAFNSLSGATTGFHPSLGNNHKIYMVAPGTFTATSDIYMGNSTYRVDTDESTPIGADHIFVVKAYGTVGRVHLMPTETAGSIISTSPRVMRGRWVEIWCAPVKETDDTVDTASAQMIWAGRVKSYKVVGDRYRVVCDPLLATLKDPRPTMMPRAKMLTSLTGSGLMYYLTDNAPGDDLASLGSLAISFCAYSVGLDFDGLEGGQFTPLVYEDSSGGHVQLEEGWHTLDTICESIVHTIRNFSWAGDIDFGSGGLTWERTGESSGSYPALVIFTNSTPYRLKIRYSGAVEAAFHGVALNKGYDDAVFFKSWTLDSAGVNSSGSYLGLWALGMASAMHSIGSLGTMRIPVVLDSASRPFIASTATETHGATRRFAPEGMDATTDAYSFVSVKSGSTEAFFGLTKAIQMISSDGRLYDLELHPWSVDHSGFEWSEDIEDALIKQVLLIDCRMLDGAGNISFSKTSDAAQLILQMLMSLGDGNAIPNAAASLLNGGIYSTLWHSFAYGIPEDYVDINGILSAAEAVNATRPCLFASEKEGGLRDAIEGLLKMSGMQLCERRYGTKFGISALPISPPAATKISRQLTATHITMGTRPEIDYNERLVVNATTAKNALGERLGNEASVVSNFLDSSISDYGLTSQVDLTSPAVFVPPTVSGDQNKLESFTAIMSSASMRWFGALGGGSYNLALSMPHYGWLCQVGDNVSITLAGVDSHTGADGLSAVVGQVVSTRHGHGSRSEQNQIVVRVAMDPVYELAPCAKVTALTVSDTVLTLATNEFSDANSEPVYSDHSAYSAQQDVHWFDRTKHGANFTVYLWNEGNYDSGQTRTISATDISANQVTLTSATTLGLSTTLYMTLAEYGTVGTTLGKSYAYVADLQNPPTLGSGDDEAKRWL